MLYYLLYPLSSSWSALNVFRYITFRSVYAAFTAFLLCLFIGPLVIRKLKQQGVGEKIRKDGPARHHAKAGTPTMGGIIIISSILISIALWARWEHPNIWITTFAMLWFGLLGFWDDYVKTVKKTSHGIIARNKLLVQIVGSAAIMAMVLWTGHAWQHVNYINIPFVTRPVYFPIWLYFIFGMTVIVGACNGVNFTDGLDGLAIGSLALVAMTFAILAYVVANIKFANYLKVIYIPAGGELVVVCSALVGAALGFLWFNSHPAEIFMGDTGSLALGGVLGTLAVLIKQEFMLVVAGGIFAAEVVSVILQVGSYKLTGKRIFLMAPLHHHFEMKGWSESKIIIRFWIVAIMLAVITLSTLKLR